VSQGSPLDKARKIPKWTKDRVVEALYGAHSSWAVPGSINLSLTYKCNIRCPYCMREEFSPPKEEYTLDRVQALMKRMPYVENVCIMGLCEPFLNPEAADIIRWLKDEAGMASIQLTTNGMVELDDDKLDALTRVDDFVISIDSADPETFKLLRGGAKLDRVLGSLERVLRYKKDRGLSKADNPPIHINAVVTSQNYDQIPDLIKMLEPYADQLMYLMVDPVTRPDYQHFEAPLMLHKELFETRIDEFRAVAKASPLQIVGFDYMFEPSYDWLNCPMAWLAMPIHTNGDAYLCGFNYDYKVGNVFEESPLRAWNSKAARDFRKALKTDAPPLEQCRSCNFARSGWQPEGEYHKRAEDAI
jgi:radical SAM protein with 4Fe4S-binding SPASM domain